MSKPVKLGFSCHMRCEDVSLSILSLFPPSNWSSRISHLLFVVVYRALDGVDRQEREGLFISAAGNRTRLGIIIKMLAVLDCDAIWLGTRTTAATADRDSTPQPSLAGADFICGWIARMLRPGSGREAPNSCTVGLLERQQSTRFRSNWCTLP